MRTKQRLVVCLDGTWNKKDDSTNVLHHFSLAVERPWPDGGGKAHQTRYYDEGVGTGVLDGITGGGFGFGLEENVRAAYDWLVEHYEDGESPEEGDEIYIFGFSRGAYTARSLIGFIATFGLLRRGAPISVNQLWGEYCLLGRAREGRTSVWDRIFGDDPATLRRINNLIVDPWLIDKFEERLKAEAGRTQGKANVHPSFQDPHRAPGQLVGDLRPAERLLLRWSRRIPIRYVGIYDTVGAVGIDALAIPGLKSKLAMHHNLRATSLVQQCRHALALDEHRSSFNHTPLTQYIGQGNNEEDNQPEALREKGGKEYWEEKKKEWSRVIEQRWFAGAHSNIGGGYPDNELAQVPLAWLLEGARAAGLECHDQGYVPPAPAPEPRDSYAEFAKPFWSEIIRGKRHYRRLAPAPEPRASPRKLENRDGHVPGYSLQSINEQFDETLLTWSATAKEYPRPHLWEYAGRRRKDEARKLREERKQRRHEQAPAQELDEVSPKQTEETREHLRLLKEIWKTKPHHPWLGKRPAPYLTLGLWATFAAVGLAAMAILFTARQPLPITLLAVVAFLFPFVDWCESRTNFWLAASGSKAWRRALYDSIYWLRALGFVLFAFGCVHALVRLGSAGWYAQDFVLAYHRFGAMVGHWWPVPLAAAAGVVLPNLVELASRRRQWAGLIGSLLSPIAAGGMAFLVVLLARLAGYVFTPAFGLPVASLAPAATFAIYGGLLILLQLAVGYFLDAFQWVGEPMGQANLGSSAALQRCFTPQAVRKMLEKWQRMLSCRWHEDDTNPATNHQGPAARAMRSAVREALWRDSLGLIPIYAGVMLFGLWFGQKYLQWSWTAREYLHLPLWLLLPITAAVADWIENACHLRYLHLHEKRQDPSQILTLLSSAATLVKFAALVTGLLPAFWAIVEGTLFVMILGEATGWRGTVALLVSVGSALFLLAIGVSAVTYRVRTKLREKDRRRNGSAAEALVPPTHSTRVAAPDPTKSGGAESRLFIAQPDTQRAPKTRKSPDKTKLS